MSKTTAKVVVAIYFTLFLIFTIWFIKEAFLNIDVTITLFIETLKIFLMFAFGILSPFILLHAISILRNDNTENGI